MLNVYEFDHTVTPGMMGNLFEVYEEDDVINPIFYSYDLDKIIDFCYTLGENFTVHTIEAYYKEFGEE